ncbi:MAG: ATP-binding cassette domain-containing protein [Dehalococcoidia bacterium]|nr:ATP-binding cassette domain-containing protein [Dehalococcoidia bacterium]
MSMLVASGLVMLGPVVIGRAIDAVDRGTSRSELAQYFGILLMLAVVEGFLRFLARNTINGTSRRVEYAMRDDMARQFMRLDQSFYIRSQTGDLMARCTNDIQRVRDLAGPATVEIGRALTYLVIGFIFMLTIDVTLALIAVAYFPVIAIVMGRFRQPVERKYREVQDQFGELANRVQENISGIRAIKAYAQEDSETETFAIANRELMRRTMNWAVYMGAFWPLMIFCAGASVVLVLWFGGRAVVAGEMTVGQFVQFLSYLAILSAPLMSVGWTLTMAQQGLASLRRVTEVFLAEPLISDPENEKHINEPRGEIEFRNVSFSYYDEPVLSEVNLTIPAGATAALVGSTGAGKTTLVNLLVRLHDPTEGQVLLDGVDIRDLPLQELRELIGFVPQETFLFSESLRDNVALSREDALDADLDYAVETSQLVNDLPQLTHGIETVLGERGVTLSGGQKQRTALARALLKAPPIVVLDDALSHVDTHTEEEILRRLHDFMKQRTTIIIAHRTSTLRAADFIVALEANRIAEIGTHDELLALGRVYANFYRRQLLWSRLRAISV